MPVTQQASDIASSFIKAKSSFMMASTQADPQSTMATAPLNITAPTQGPNKAEDEPVNNSEKRSPPPYSTKIGLGFTLGDLINDKPFNPYVAPTTSNADIAPALDEAEDTDDAEKKKAKKKATTKEIRKPAPKKQPAAKKAASKKAPAAPKPKVERKRGGITKPKASTAEEETPVKKGGKKRAAESGSEGGERKKVKGAQ